MTLNKIKVSVIAIEHLIKLKQKANRDQDKIDISQLKEIQKYAKFKKK